MKVSEALAEAVAHYREIIETYCQIAVQSDLSETEADQLTAILQQAQTDSALSLLLDEADHLLAHKHNLIDESRIRWQQQQLYARLENQWLDQLLQDMQATSRSEKAALQQYLQAQGVYAGAIDGVCGPQMQAALKALTCQEGGDLLFD
ncbi:peptidoglycan-binding domain-containing protein [Almyronema epifaneia]|uniref:Peptidoglycan-binding protein n=1 Tax=Almyronema epifaneia S1 TaxID=2991925 RepID=A0ABW6IGX4_9CYAN